MVVTDNLAMQTNYMFTGRFDSFAGLTLFVLMLAFAVQIFADFATYSTIAIGLAALFGYKLKENFLFPFVAVSFADLWKRWHISLSEFLRDYLYIPLGRNQKGKIKTYFNLMLTMLLGGFWHGAEWGFLFWGFLHGFALCIERAFKQNSPNNFLMVRRFFVFLYFAFAILLFRLYNLTHYFLHLKKYFKITFL